MVEKNQSAWTRGKEHEQVNCETVNITRNVGGEGFQESELFELEVSNEPLNVDEIEEMLENLTIEEEITDEESEPILTAKTVGNFSADATNIIELAVNKDPIMTRSLQFKHDINRESYRML